MKTDPPPPPPSLSLSLSLSLKKMKEDTHQQGKENEHLIASGLQFDQLGVGANLTSLTFNVK